MENNQENIDTEFDDQPTLDPPGSIAVIGGGPLGLEAAIYGRYLGYQVTLFEAECVASVLIGREGEPIPISPDRCVSPVSRSALTAQSGAIGPATSPTTVGEWLDQVWRPLAATDLLRGRVHEGAKVERIEQVELTDDETGEALPPDFRVHVSGHEGGDFEAIIVATGHAGAEIDCSFELPTDYYFRIGGLVPDVETTGRDVERDFWTGLKEIVAVYASLGGRADLDLYRPARG
ncbi:NAD-binding protein [Rhodopirellula sp. MGV]|uniref:NAD-binding protein n=1 Tax=Rhodopirellula sp. MGV TaxID=2023130 RepID=UPI000B96C7B9|nr:NAD-binding protein [Rhodopirellula sp. MGV]OYP29847.1 hypothetical protein CGZ80_23955 [Rhodopirellula sp. MGV]PNY33729.1 hypothetical protein C2E31_26930 [Rhodopirellula baltica]